MLMSAGLLHRKANVAQAWGLKMDQRQSAIALQSTAGGSRHSSHLGCQLENAQYSKADLHKGEKSKTHWLHTFRKATVWITDNATYWAGCEAARSCKHCRWECRFPHAECRNPCWRACRCSTASLEDRPAGSCNTGRAPPL